MLKCPPHVHLFLSKNESFDSIFATCLTQKIGVMKKAFTILALLTGCILHPNVSEAKTTKQRHETRCEYKVLTPQKQTNGLRVEGRENESTANVKITMKPATDRLEQWDKAVAIDKKTGKSIDIKFPFQRDPDTGRMTVASETSYSLPLGEYFLGMVIKSDFGYSLVIKDIQISQDLSLVFSSDEATVQPRFKTIMPNGEELKIPVIEYIDEEPGIRYVEEGNADQLYALVWLKHEKLGTLFGFDYWIYYDYVGNTERPDYVPAAQTTDVKVSPLDDNFSIWVQKTIINDEGLIVFANTGTKTISNEVISNRHDEYVMTEAKFVNTPASEKYTDEPECSLKYSIWLNNIRQYDLGPWIDKPVTKAAFYNSAESEEEGYVSALNFIYPDGAYTYEEKHEDGYVNVMTETMNIVTNPVIARNGHVEYVNRHHSNIDTGRNLQSTPEGNHYIELPGHARFSFIGDQQPEPVYGNSSPICSLKTQIQPGDNPDVEYNIFNPSYLGRYGEGRFSDEKDLEISLKYNGEESILPGEALNVWAGRFGNAKHPYGVFDLSIINRNVRVDDISGHNTMHAMVDWTTGDKYAPTIQMLMFRGADGLITDRFEDAEGTCVEFAGADFVFHPTPPYHFTHLPATARTEYSPYGENLWTELKTEELPEYFFMPNFGYFFRSSLEGVSLPSPNKWYDLKVTITDEAGNYQEQVISPAFRLENPSSGIGEVSKVDSTEISSIHDLLGHKQQSLQPGVNIVTLSNGKNVKIIR